ncbi:unnamed protein product [Cuscuta epithymum]|uniref:Aminotransferase-like plant mobile domain-containing protein n=2 Tax=Cuscuta epithymum TaxID=186058 RepID=A0AAV0DYK0_9ASTE|nr:unnamed protein product [Cuscuta epithymum]
MDLLSEYEMMKNADKHETPEGSERILDPRPISEIPVLRSNPKKRVKKTSKVPQKQKKMKPKAIPKKEKANMDLIKQIEAEIKMSDEETRVAEVRKDSTKKTEHVGEQSEKQGRDTEHQGKETEHQERETEEHVNVEETSKGGSKMTENVVEESEHRGSEPEQQGIETEQHDNVEETRNTSSKTTEEVGEESEKQGRENEQQGREIEQNQIVIEVQQGAAQRNNEKKRKRNNAGSIKKSTEQGNSSKEKESEEVSPKRRTTRSTTSEATEKKNDEVQKKKKEVHAKKKITREADSIKEKKQKIKKKKAEEEEEFEEDEEEIEKEENAKYPKLWTRMSPSSITEIMKNLSAEQKKEVVEMGFGPLLNLEVKQLPMQLAYWLLDNFDSRSVSLLLPNNERLRINEDGVHVTLGFPKGKINVKNLIDTESENTSHMVANWRSQFQTENGVVKTAQVKKVIEENKAGGVWFKKNFLVLLVTCLIEGKQNCFANQSILKALQDDSKIKDLNWCGYTLETLIEAKDYWSKNRERQFPGPLLFLIVFYVDNIVFKGRKVDRAFPSIIGWTTQKLNKRQKEEIETGGFGYGYIDEPNKGELIVPKLITNEEEAEIPIEGNSNQEPKKVRTVLCNFNRNNWVNI